ncbi:hypothetical protein RM704_26700 [Streptomyces sp. DSM 3412]|uniref:Uncharacterized protein n=1 Tax=Streptomyces gottesmaniae TaxID=3075518 RepID=A0ABU2Z400_9ACTN|nr:hypothetical protein [Streptomyces sp. DSM 3412]MDT0571009.1 hypothetical protein [Streptomyces sp. DSM 3412]
MTRTSFVLAPLLCPPPLLMLRPYGRTGDSTVAAVRRAHTGDAHMREGARHE